MFLSFGYRYFNKTLRALKRILLICCMLISGFFAQAQNHHEIGLSVGVANYYGDLQNHLFPSYGYKPMVGIIYKYFMSPRVGLRLGASYASVTAADSLSDVPTNKARNLSFATNIFEMHGGLEINFLPVDIDRMKVSPYIFGGVALFYFDPYAEDIHNNKTYLRPLSTEGEGMAIYPDRKPYKLIQAAFPVGGGLKFLIGKTLMLTTELGFRYTATDYLDDVSKSYVNLDSLNGSKGKLAVQMSYRGNQVPGSDNNYRPNYGYQRGDSNANDWYWFGNITVAIYFRAFGNYGHCKECRCPGSR